MRYHDITEGRALTFTLRYGNNHEDVLVIQNPTVAQAQTLIERSRHGDGKFYLRGLCLNGKTLYVWNGWKATHDDVRVEYMPKIEEHFSELTTFEVSDAGGEVVKPGDFDLFANRYYQNILMAINT